MCRNDELVVCSQVGNGANKRLLQRRVQVQFKFVDQYYRVVDVEIREVKKGKMARSPP